MGLDKAKYDKYVSWKKPWFYVLIYVGDTKKRYIHQLQDPKKRDYEVEKYGGVDYYTIPPTDYWEAAEPDFPVKLPELDGLSPQQSLALSLALDDWARSGFSIEFKGFQDDDLKKADAILHSPYPTAHIRMRKWKRENQDNAGQLKPKSRQSKKRKSRALKSSNQWNAEKP
jgi:hypothetical protein